MAKAFLSHSSKDKELVNFLGSELGHSNVVIDSLSFESGQKSIEEIYRTMDNSDIFVLFISEDAINSEWVEKEIFYADGLIRNEKLGSFLPIVIDDTKHDDERIPAWLRKEYSLRPIKNEQIILNKIRNEIRKVNFKLNPINEEIENTFIGQSDLIDKEVNKFYNAENWKPSCIIAYSHIEGIGRRTVTKNLLKKVRLYKEKYSPVEISISKESIESFILKLNSNILEDNITQIDFSEISLEEKVSIAVDLIELYADNQEIIFIIDDGSIILPNTKIVDWFAQIICNEKFKNKLVVCLISTFRPDKVSLRKWNTTLDFKVEELNKRDTESLFFRYLEILNVGNIDPSDKKIITNKLNGIPSQIIFAANLIDEEGILEAKKNINEIVEFSDHSSSSLIEIIKKDHLSFSILLLLSRNPEVFSWTLLYKVFDNVDEKEINKSLQRLYDLSVISFLHGGYEYMKLSPSLADYINRSKLSLDEKYIQKLNSILETDLIGDRLDSLYKTDYSEFLINLQSMIENKQHIKKKYFLPSFLLKSIIKEYDKGHDEVVVDLCNKLLQNSDNKYDSQIIWELYYKLCQSLSKLGRTEEFFERIRYFKDNDLEYNFLMGFYFRHNKDREKALIYYTRVLEINQNHKRAKHELVNIYLQKREYGLAFDMAEENYNYNKNNVYNIHSLFICIVRTGRGKKYINKLNELLENIQKSLSIKGQDMYRCMKGEYEFYINDNLQEAIKLLEDAKNLNENKSYPIIALELIYRKKDMREALKNLDIRTNSDEDLDYLNTN